ncbi:hypothetical protein [Ruegeria marisrubri]|uniref:hypothetical protein n=1 Tax=Ruegeria marisrubri TaxID=1685379 RepID=UPI0012FE43B1|nr:hypothetical protein [Ruegeria marisrubri]
MRGHAQASLCVRSIAVAAFSEKGGEIGDEILIILKTSKLLADSSASAQKSPGDCLRIAEKREMLVSPVQ